MEQTGSIAKRNDNNYCYRKNEHPIYAMKKKTSSDLGLNNKISLYPIFTDLLNPRIMCPQKTS